MELDFCIINMLCVETNNYLIFSIMRKAFVLYNVNGCSTKINNQFNQGRPSPPRQWCISLCFRFSPYFRKEIRTPWKIFTILPSPKKCFDFKPPKFLMTLFSNWLQILNFPLFSLFQYIFPNYYFPSAFANLPSDFVKFTCFTYFLCFSFLPPTESNYYYVSLFQLLRSVSNAFFQ